jgi:iron(III) transport system substrate-binding protein
MADRLTRAIALLTGLVLGLTACGAPPTAQSENSRGTPGERTKAEQVYAEIGALKGKERRNRLVELVKKEGGLTLYTSLTNRSADKVKAAFKDAFGIEINLYRASSETILQRVLQEQRANFKGADVVESNTLEMMALQTEGHLAAYTGERRDLVPEGGRFERWTATRFNLFSPSWNTNLVKAGQPPTTWEDLADSKWDGKLSLELSDYDWYMTLYGYWEKQGKSRAEIDKLFGDMVTGAKIVKGHSVQAELMSAGQFGLAASNYTYLVEQWKRDGAPVDYRPLVEPVIARANGAGLMRNAPHPAGAMLFMDWILQEGQAVLIDSGLTPAIAPKEDPLKGAELLYVDVDKLLAEGTQWSKRYEQLVSRGEKFGG